MSHGLEFPAPQARPASSNVVSLSEAGIEKSDTSSFAIEARLAGFVSGSVQDGSEQWFQSFLSQLRPGESLSLRVAFGDGGGLSFGATACAPQPAIEARARELELALREVVASAAPHFKLAADRAVRASRPTLRGRPAAGRPAHLPRRFGVPRAPACRDVQGTPFRGSSTCAALGALPGAASRSGCRRRPHEPTGFAGSRAGSRPVVLSSRRPLQAGAAGVPEGLGAMRRGGAHDVPLILLNDRVLQQLKAWSTASYGLRLTARLSARESRLRRPSRHVVPGALRIDQVHRQRGVGGRPDGGLAGPRPRLPRAPARDPGHQGAARCARQSGLRGQTLARHHPRPAR